MIKLIKLCFVCCLIFRATFVEADYQNYEKYINELKELEERYRNVDKTIDLSGCTMRQVIIQLRDILRMRIHNPIGASRKQDSYPALLKVNDDYYELYFQGTESQPGNCLLKRQGGKPKAWLKNYEYNSKLNTEKNYVEQNLLFCLEIARRKLCLDDNEDNYTKKTKVFQSIKGTLVGCGGGKYVMKCNDGKHVRCDSRGKGIKYSENAEPFVKYETENKYVKYDDHYDAAILDVIVIGLNLVNNRNECPTFSFFGCFDSNDRKNIADIFIKKAGLDDRTLGKLKLEFYNKQIDDKDVIARGCEKYFKNDLSYFVKNGEVVEKLRGQNFTHCEPIENLTSEVLDTTNFSEETTAESVIDAIDSVKKFLSPFESNTYKEGIEKISEELSPIYVLDGNATKNFVKFLAPKNIKRKRKHAEKQIKKGDVDSVKSLCENHFKKGFVFLYATGKDDTTRWFYLNKSNGTMYLLSKTPKSKVFLCDNCDSLQKCPPVRINTHKTLSQNKM